MQPTNDHTPGTSWLTRAKLAVAGVALAALAVFGAAGIGAPDTSDTDEQAKSKCCLVVNDDTVDTWGKGGGFDTRAFATWS